MTTAAQKAAGKKERKLTIWERAKEYAVKSMNDARMYELKSEWLSLLDDMRDEVAIAYDAGFQAGIRSARAKRKAK